MPKLEEMMDSTASSIQRPPNVPAGHFHATISKHPQVGELKQGEYQFLDFPVTLVEPVESAVDEDQLSAFGDVRGTPMTKRFLLPTAEEESTSFMRTQYTIRRFLESLDLGFSENGEMSFKEALAECVGASVVVEVRHRPNPNEEGAFFDEIGRIAPGQ